MICFGTSPKLGPISGRFESHRASLSPLPVLITTGPLTLLMDHHSRFTPFDHQRHPSPSPSSPGAFPCQKNHQRSNFLRLATTSFSGHHHRSPTILLIAGHSSTRSAANCCLSPPSNITEDRLLTISYTLTAFR